MRIGKRRSLHLFQEKVAFRISALLFLSTPTCLSQFLARVAPVSSVYRASVLMQQRGANHASRGLIEAAARREIHFAERPIGETHDALIDTEIAGSIGHTALGLGTRLMLEALAMRRPHRYTVASSRIANRTLMELMVGARSISTTPLGRNERRRYAKQRIMWIETDGGPIRIYEAASLAHREFELTQDLPLLRIPESQLLAARTFLADHGLRSSSWFVVLHVREGEFDPLNYGRNARIQDYSLLLREVVDRGGYVVRLGSPSRWQMPAHPNLIDLTNSRRPPDVDIYCLAHARLFVGTNSGPTSVAPLFGTPTLWTNATGIGMQVNYQPRTLVIPKLIGKHESGEALGFTTAAELGLLAIDGSLPKSRNGRLNYSWLDNDPGLIREGLVEMLDDTTSRSSDEQYRFAQLLTEFGNEIPPKISNSFARRYLSLVNE